MQCVRVHLCTLRIVSDPIRYLYAGARLGGRQRWARLLSCAGASDVEHNSLPATHDAWYVHAAHGTTCTACGAAHTHICSTFRNFFNWLRALPSSCVQAASGHGRGGLSMCGPGGGSLALGGYRGACFVREPGYAFRLEFRVCGRSEFLVSG